MVLLWCEHISRGFDRPFCSLPCCALSAVPLEGLWQVAGGTPGCLLGPAGSNWLPALPRAVSCAVAVCAWVWVLLVADEWLETPTHATCASFVYAFQPTVNNTGLGPPFSFLAGVLCLLCVCVCLMRFDGLQAVLLLLCPWGQPPWCGHIQAPTTTHMLPKPKLPLWAVYACMQV